MPNLAGQTIDRYHIIEQIGEGGMATVYKAFDTRLEREVALKIIRKGVFGADVLDRVLKRFNREGKALARLSHPHIIKVFDFGEFEGSPYLVMEFVQAGTLKQKLGKPLPWQEAVGLVLPIARALGYAHQNGVIHRDVKPSNILLTPGGDPLLTDFGIARLLETEEGQTLTGTGVGVGTPEYMAPEQGLGAKDVDGRADQYALGVVLYELITGRKPYIADTPMAVVVMHVHDPLPRPRQFVPSLPVVVEQVLFKALAKKPEDRYPNMEAFVAALEKLLNGPLPAPKPKPIPAPRPSPPVSAQETHDDLIQPLPHRKIPWVWLGGSIGVIALIAIGIVIAGQPRGAEPLPTEIIPAVIPIETTPTPQPSVTVQINATNTPQSANLAYQVQEGDSCWSIAQTWDIDISLLLSINNFPDGACPISLGQTILIPGPGYQIPTATPIPIDLPSGTQIQYTVQTGDNLALIASRFNSTEEAILRANATILVDQNSLFTGMTLFIPVNLVTPTATLLPTSGATHIREADGMVMMYIPGGTFEMGSDSVPNSSEYPAHTVSLSPYWMDQTEVTNAQYTLCVSRGSCAYTTDSSSFARTNYYGSSEFANYPVINVSITQAQNYCHWAGGRLPTEAEWEFAARGTDGRSFPWGNEGYTCDLANYSPGNNPCVGDTTEVGSYPAGASPFGILDMGGNVWEYVSDGYGPYLNEPVTDPLGNNSSGENIIRGGGWNSIPIDMFTANREVYSVYSRLDEIGFRCAMDAEP